MRTTLIISDGPYGLNGYDGDLKRPDQLPAWYEPHIAAWTRRATASTTLWFWNTEVGWAEVHSILRKAGWVYRACCIWDKGLAHVAGNTNTRTLRKFPVVTEVCVHYVREPQFRLATDGRRIRFSLNKRGDRPTYFVYYRLPDGRRAETSTKEANRRKAQDAALAIIRETYAPPPAPPTEPESTDSLLWDDALQLALRHMKANNLRATTIQQYELAVNTLRKIVPDSKGPDDITPALAEHFKLVRLEKGRKPRTVENDINNLSIVYGHWFRDTLKIIDSNPFADVEPPRYDKAPARYIAEDEQQALFNWLKERWQWRLPVLFLETKAAIGCRIGELSSALTVNLREGRLYFPADATKGREERACLLPKALYDELRAKAGPTYVFERFSEELREVHRRKGNHQPANAVRAFTPARLKRWMQDEAKYYFDRTKARKFKLHNFRGTAMSKARVAGVSTDDAAIAFDCTVATMQQHYLAFDKARVADEVFSRIQNGRANSGSGHAAKESNATVTPDREPPSGEPMQSP